MNNDLPHLSPPMKKDLMQLESEFDYPVDGLKDILINCNLNYSIACNMCEEFGIKRKKSSSPRREKLCENSEVIYRVSKVAGPYEDPDIRFLCTLFPSISVEVVAGLFWDNGNDIRLTISKLTENTNQVPYIDLEYLRLEFSFISADQVTAIFIRNKNDYLQSVRDIELEFADVLSQNREQLVAFRMRYCRYSHESVVQLHQNKVKRCKSVVIHDDYVIEDAPTSTSYVPHDRMRVVSERRQANEHLTNLRILQNQRQEQARGYGKYLDFVENSMNKEQVLYAKNNEESGMVIFAEHNDHRSLGWLMEHNRSIDFHGLQVGEVAQYMDKILSILKKNKSRKRITIITGSGNHSKNNISPVRLYVEARIRDLGLPYEFFGGQISFSWLL